MSPAARSDARVNGREPGDLSGRPRWGRRSIVVAFAAVTALAVGARLWLAWSFHGNFDQDSFEIVRGLVERGENVYAGTVRYNYSPVWFLLLGLFGRVSELAGLPFHFVIRAFLTFVDVGIALLLAAAAWRLGRSPALPALIFLANPVSIAVTGYHGQFDNLATLFVLAAVVVQLPRPQALAASSLLTIGVVVKQTVAPDVLYVLSGSIRSPLRRLLVAIAIGGVFVATFLPFIWAPGALTGVLANVFGYGVYGGRDLTVLMAAFGVSRILILVGAGMAAHRLPLERAALLGALLFVATAGPSLRSTQYLVLPIAFGALMPSPIYLLYSAVSFLVMIASPAYLGLTADVAWWMPWAVAVGWVVEFWLTGRRRGPETREQGVGGTR